MDSLSQKFYRTGSATAASHSLSGQYALRTQRTARTRSTAMAYRNDQAHANARRIAKTRRTARSHGASGWWWAIIITGIRLAFLA